jgi:hypothetical protein
MWQKILITLNLCDGYIPSIFVSRNFIIKKYCVLSKADTLKQLRPIGKGDQELEKRLDQKELT